MSWKYVVLHHSAGHDTDGLDADNIRDFHIKGRGWRDVGYHFLLESVDGGWVALQGRSLTWPGSHEPKANREGIGICFVGNYSETMLPDAAVKAGAQLIASLFVLMGIRKADDTTIRLHRQFKATECPGKHFPAAEIRDRVQELLDSAEV